MHTKPAPPHLKAVHLVRVNSVRPFSNSLNSGADNCPIHYTNK